jgi:hypothetical protein
MGRVYQGRWNQDQDQGSKNFSSSDDLQLGLGGFDNRV